MATYMLAQLQLKFGMANIPLYNEAMATIRDLIESQGIRLRHASLTIAGQLYEAWNLWEIEDPGHISRAFANMDGAAVLAANAALAEVVVDEKVHYLTSLPFGPAQ